MKRVALSGGTLTRNVEISNSNRGKGRRRRRSSVSLLTQEHFEEDSKNFHFSKNKNFKSQLHTSDANLRVINTILYMGFPMGVQAKPLVGQQAIQISLNDSYIKPNLK